MGVRARSDPREPSGARTTGIRLRTANIAMIVLGIVLAVLLVFGTYSTSSSYTSMREATQRYIDCQNDAIAMQSTSDYLTEQARAFISTGDVAYANAYTEEIETTKRRDKALADLGHYFSGTATYAHLESALETSDELADIERYAMRLAAAGYGCEEKLPGSIADVALDEADVATGDQMVRAALDMVYGPEYQSYKDGISASVDQTLDDLLDSTHSDQVASLDNLLDKMRWQYVVIALMAVVVIAIVVMTSLLVVRPLRKSVSLIKQRKELEPIGAYELRYLAQAYNAMFEQTQTDQDRLAYEASHDALTGVYNRAHFDKMRLLLLQRKDIALLLVDVDEFKAVNDNYGHDVGDRLLKRVADKLHASFRSADHVCRIGGDEFAVIMTHVDSSMRDLVEAKVSAANAFLSQPSAGLPGVTLSVGVAFGDRKNATDDIFKDADTALYRTKEAGRNGIRFYE